MYCRAQLLRYFVLYVPAENDVCVLLFTACASVERAGWVGAWSGCGARCVGLGCLGRCCRCLHDDGALRLIFQLSKQASSQVNERNRLQPTAVSDHACITVLCGGCAVAVKANKIRSTSTLLGRTAPTVSVSLATLRRRREGTGSPRSPIISTPSLHLPSPSSSSSSSSLR